MYPNLKAACHVKLKFFLRTELIESLLLAKYFISVTAPLIFKAQYDHGKWDVMKNLHHC